MTDPASDAVSDDSKDTAPGAAERLDLGAFSVSLSVADLERSLDFYQKLGFVITDEDQGWGLDI